MDDKIAYFEILNDRDWKSVKKWVTALGDDFDDLFWIMMPHFTFSINIWGGDNIQVLCGDYLVRESAGVYRTYDYFTFQDKFQKIKI